VCANGCSTSGGNTATTPTVFVANSPRTIPPGAHDKRRDFDAGRLAAEAAALNPARRLDFCRALLDQRQNEPFVECSAFTVGNGSALLLRLTKTCTHGACSVDNWLLSRRRGRPLRLPDTAGTIEATPDASIAFVDVHRSGERENLAEPLIVTLRMDLASGSVTELGGCFAPRLSPGGAWIVCRDVHANVLRVRLDGSELEVVALSGWANENVAWVPERWVYPAPVAFPQSNELRYEISLADGTSVTRTEAWTE
jgi:hypothetical protein